MNKRPLWVLLAVAVAAIAVLVLIIPDDTPTTIAGPNGTVITPSPQDEPDEPEQTQNGSVTTPPEGQPTIEIPDLAAGTNAPQMVVLSFDGGVENKTGIMKHYVDLAQEVDGNFSFFISGVYLLPDDKNKLVYDPPRHPKGTSAIGFGDPSIIDTRINMLSEAYRNGDEIGTHYNGHFCGAGGVAAWNAADWTSEINQFNNIIDNWRTYNPQASSDTKALPFNSSVVKGGRTPCLEGDRKAMGKAFLAAGYRYDTSDGGDLKWPHKWSNGMWEIPLQAIKIPGVGPSKVLSMDYNFLVNQNGVSTTASQEKCDKIEDQAYNAYMNALTATNGGNRAPLILGNHMNDWVCGAYTKALTRFVKDAHEKFPDVKFVSNLDLVNWMDRQDPALLQTYLDKPTQN